MTWVPPYAVQNSKAQLLATPSKGKWMNDALTHLGLQWWQPTNASGVSMVNGSGVSDAGVIELRNWCHSNGIRAMLCVFNAAGGSWDWPLAKSAFADNPKKFAKALVDEVVRLDLDGVDLDLEGNGELDGDRTAYVAFVTDLSAKLKSRRKHLTIDTFAYIWHAPNQTWWPDLLPLVDGLTSMGYEETGRSGADWRSYASQKAAAGTHAGRLMIGMPASLDQWQGNDLADQLAWIQGDGGVGASFWDAQLPATSWRKGDTWKTLAAIRKG
jgi:hypothetical protein